MAPFMEMEPRLLRFKPRRFGGKIVLLVLTIIAVSLALGTFLSVLSFEEIYLKALLSKYEILGKDLNRKIEQALKFGKPLDRLLGMDTMAEELFSRAEELEEASVFDLEGRPLFSFRKAEFVMARGVVDESERGKVLLGGDLGIEARYTGDLRERQGPWPLVRLSGGLYRLVFPVKPPFGARKGYLELAFGRSVVEDKTRDLIRRSLTQLILAIALTGVAAALLIRFLFVDPARRQVRRMEATALGAAGETPLPVGDTGVSDELKEVEGAVQAYVTMTAEARDEVLTALEGLERPTAENPHAAHVIRLMKRVLEGETHEDL